MLSGKPDYFAQGSEIVLGISGSQALGDIRLKYYGNAPCKPVDNNLSLRV